MSGQEYDDYDDSEEYDDSDDSDSYDSDIYDIDYGTRNGTIKYTNGDIYTGKLRKIKEKDDDRDLPYGYGIMRYANGEVYEGEWEDEFEKYGNGIMRYANGDVYTGEWISNEKYGYGTMIYASGYVFEGEWRNDSIHGKNNYINQKSFKHIPSNVKLYDPIMMEEENLHEFLKTKDNLVFIFGNNYFPLNKDTIRIQMKNPLNIVFECFISGILEPDNINKKVKYLRLNSLGIPGDFINLKRMQSILLFKQQIYNMVETDKVLVTVISDNVLNHRGSRVGASYCQSGQGGKVYDVDKKIIRAYSKRNRKDILSITKRKKGYFSKSKSSKIKNSILKKKKSNSNSKKKSK